MNATEITYTTKNNPDNKIKINFYADAASPLTADMQLQTKLREMRNHGLRPFSYQTVEIAE